MPPYRYTNGRSAGFRSRANQITSPRIFFELVTNLNFANNTAAQLYAYLAKPEVWDAFQRHVASRPRGKIRTANHAHMGENMKAEVKQHWLGLKYQLPVDTTNFSMIEHKALYLITIIQYNRRPGNAWESKGVHDFNEMWDAACNIFTVTNNMWLRRRERDDVSVKQTTAHWGEIRKLRYGNSLGSGNQEAPVHNDTENEMDFENDSEIWSDSESESQNTSLNTPPRLRPRPMDLAMNRSGRDESSPQQIHNQIRTALQGNGDIKQESLSSPVSPQLPSSDIQAPPLHFPQRQVETPRSQQLSEQITTSPQISGTSLQAPRLDLFQNSQGENSRSHQPPEQAAAPQPQSTGTRESRSSFPQSSHTSPYSSFSHHRGGGSSQFSLLQQGESSHTSLSLHSQSENSPSNLSHLDINEGSFSFQHSPVTSPASQFGPHDSHQVTIHSSALQLESRMFRNLVEYQDKMLQRQQNEIQQKDEKIRRLEQEIQKLKQSTRR